MGIAVSFITPSIASTLEKLDGEDVTDMVSRNAKMALMNKGKEYSDFSAPSPG